MKRTLDAYLLRLDNWFDPQLCRDAVAALDEASWSPHSYTARGEDEPRTSGGETELDIAFASDLSVTAAITRKIALATRLYAVRLQLPWFSPPRHHTDVRYNRYAPGQLMLEHCDHIDLFEGKGVPILSCLTMLNDDYEGGELVIWGDQIIPTRAGTTIIFPSNFLYPHRVEPVRAGLRYSCISWAW